MTSSHTSYGKRVARIRALLILLIIAVVGVVVFFFRGQNEAVLAEFSQQDTEFEEAVLAGDTSSFSVVNENGNFANIQAGRIVQRDQTSGIVGSALEGDLQLSGATWKVSSDNGVAPTNYDQIDFSDNVLAVSDSGIEIRTDSVRALIDDGRLIANDTIALDSRDLRLVADSAKVEGEEGARVIHFEGNVSGQIMLTDDIVSGAGDAQRADASGKEEVLE